MCNFSVFFTIIRLHFTDLRLKEENTAAGALVTSDLIGRPEDILDTWGPGYYISVHSPTSPVPLRGICVAGGTIMATKEKSYHWFRTTVPNVPSDGTFYKDTQLRISARVSVNRDCNFDEDKRWQGSDPVLEHLGVSEERWELAQL